MEIGSKISPQKAGEMAANSVSGVLTGAGEFTICHEKTIGFVVSCSEAELAAVAYLPMSQRVVIVPECEFVTNAQLSAILHAAQRATTLECTCGGNPADDPQCCSACKVYHHIESAKRDLQNDKLRNASDG